MKLALAAALLLATTASAQTATRKSPFADPANLRGERPTPRTGRELPIDQGARGLQQQLRRLNTRASLMLIVAHPDDEDGGMLTLYSRGLGARVATLTLTRGEGGQNAMTGDFEDALGLIRTQELLSADRYFGADQLFGTEVDFGFSKTKEEAFSKWTHGRVLYDAVRAVRLYRPLVIAAVFIGGVTDGHGQHQVSGEIAQEVFRAAGDPKIFPELTAEGILPWQPLKVYARVPAFAITGKGLFDYATNQYAPARFTDYVTGQTTTTPPSVDLTVHEGQTDPLLSDPGEEPRNYVQFARSGLGLQKTQIGPGVRLATSGAYDVGYHLYGTRLCSPPSPRQTVILSGAQSAQSKTPCISPAAAKPSAPTPAPQTPTFFDGIDTSLAGIGTLSPNPPAELTRTLRTLSASLAQAQRTLDPKHPEALAPQLATAQNQLSALLYKLENEHFPGKPDVLHELRIKQVQLNEALTDALGLTLTAKLAASSPDVVKDTPGTVQTVLQTASTQPVGVFAESLEGSEGAKAQQLLAVDKEPVLTATQPLSETLAYTAKLTYDRTQPYFFRTDIEQPVYQLADPTLRNAAANPPALVSWATLRYHQVEVTLGHVVNQGDQPVMVVPELSLALSAHAQALPTHQDDFIVATLFQPPAPPLGDLELGLPQGWHATPAPAASSHPGEQTFNIHLSTAPAPVVLQASVRLPSGATYTTGYRGVGYPGLPRTNFYQPASDRIVPVDLNLPTAHRIGYLPGTGDAVPQALASIGLPVSILTVADLTPEHLTAFDTVILGVRTYNAHPDLHGAPTQALFDFARHGGNVVVQYQTGEFTAADAPYPLALGNAEKVVDETAPVRLLQPQAALLSTPNRLTAADFHGWIEERGHGFLSTWDPHYTALTETHDPGQDPQQGGLITTQFGNGHWTYCAFALYRQLPEAVPGAFRLFVNLLALTPAQQP